MRLVRGTSPMLACIWVPLVLICGLFRGIEPVIQTYPETSTMTKEEDR